ncbi:MAG: RNase P subunit p30 family protein [Promethearchaeota archaeon]
MKEIPRNFVDSLIPCQESQLSTFVHIAIHLGFTEIWISNPTKEEKKEMIHSSFSSLISMHERLDIGLNNESKAQMTSLLSHKRRDFPIIAVTCANPDLTAWAAQDNRVDILRFPLFQTGKLMTRSIAKLMVKFEKCLEIQLCELYSLPERQQIPALRQIRSAVEIAIRKKVPIIVSSGSTRPEQMRAPRELASLSQMLLDDSVLSLNSLSIIPQQLVKRNLKKINQDYIAPGVFKITSPSLQSFGEEE